MLGSRTLGPRDENCAITGDGWTSTTVLDRWRTAVGLELELMYFRMVTALAADTAVPGRTCASTGTSLPDAGGLPRIMAAPPARFTSRPFSTRRPEPLRHTTILPRTLLDDREFGRHWLRPRAKTVEPCQYCSCVVCTVKEFLARADDYLLGVISRSPRNDSVCCVN
jgi:hypothetical protein